MLLQAAGPAPDAAVGRALYRQAGEMLLLARTDSAMRLLQAAIQAAPDDHAIHLVYILRRWEDGEFRSTAAEYRARRHGDPDIRACLAAVTDFSFFPGYDGVAMARAQGRLAAIRNRAGAPGRSCAIAMQSFLRVRATNPLQWNLAVAAEIDAALALTPQSTPLWLDGANVLSRADPKRLSAHCAAGRATLRDVAGRFYLAAQCISLAFAAGDRARAALEYRALAAAVRRDGRPALRLRLLTLVVTEVRLFVTGTGDTESIRREILALAADVGDWRTQYITGVVLSRSLIDAGEPTRALADIDRALAIAEARANPAMQLRARTLRGRALTRAGRPAEALADLRHATVLGNQVDDVYEAAEAWHNLGHAYEALGRWAQAAAAADRFVALTSTFQWDGLRVIALRDAGEIKAKAGWQAAANADYQRMVDVVREVDAHHQWAGEYLERRGRLREAAEMYRRGVAYPSNDPLDLAGLARVYTALKQYDSAAVIAARHDAARRDWRPGEVPLVPAILARQGRVAEARRILADWAATRLRGGDVQGAAHAHLTWAQMSLRDGAVTEADRASAVAESLATLVSVTDDAVKARLLRVRLLSARGEHARALALAAAVTADRSLAGNAPLRFEAALAAGDAASRAGRTTDALAAYTVASGVVDTASATLTADFDRASYRDRHLAPFDSALALLHRETTARPRLLLEWSARRKAASLRFGDAGRSSVPALEVLQRRLEPGTLFLDYVLAADAAILIALTRESVQVLRLRTPLATLEADVARARRGLDEVWIGRVDVARARPDSAALTRLSEVLLRPVASELARARRLLIASDGALIALPFEMLPDPNRTTQPLLLATAVGYVPGAWAIGTSRVHRTSRVLIVAQDAPGATTEREGIRAAWPIGATTHLDGTAASEDALNLQRRGQGILHIIAHAINDGRDPSASHLRLAASATNDGYLHTGELGAWRSAPSLVILSACATAAGAALAGEGAFSLSRAFLRAGAQEVVATHWPIGPTAAQLATHLHRELAAGATTLDALTTARRALYANPATRHPFYWASFVLTIADSR